MAHMIQKIISHIYITIQMHCLQSKLERHHPSKQNVIRERNQSWLKCIIWICGSAASAMGTGGLQSVCFQHSKGCLVSMSWLTKENT